VKGTPRPALVWWRNETIILNGVEIDFNKYKAHLRKKMDETNVHLMEKVLCGLYSTMGDIELKFNIRNIQDDGNEDRLGYGIIADSTDVGLDNEQSNLFFQDMFKKKVLGLDKNSTGDLIFDMAAAHIWLSDIHMAMMNIFSLCHITTICGRGTEAEALNPTNTHRGRRNVVFDGAAATGAFDTDYHKGQRITGKPKHILRHIPYEVFRSLFILVRISRPVELLIACSIIATKPEQEIKIQDAYANHVFASLGTAWDTTKMSLSLKLFFHNLTERPMPKMGIHLYRHLGIALQRKFLHFSKNDQSAALEETLHRLSGHEKVTADGNYALQIPLGTSSVDERERSLLVNQMWHKILAFPTAYNDVPMGPTTNTEGIELQDQVDVKPEIIYGQLQTDKGKKMYGQLQASRGVGSKLGPSTSLRTSSRKRSQVDYHGME
jgi:hypothetical protein